MLSKSKLMAFRQCPRRLWLEVHRPELRADSSAAQARFNAGYEVGEMARQLYDPDGRGVLIDAQKEGYPAAFARTSQALGVNQPIFEAGFASDGVVAFADVMLPVGHGRELAWRMVEVKSSTEVKNYHQDDVAVQSFAARRAGVPLASVCVAHVDSTWVYPGGGDYAGLLKEVDLTKEAFNRELEVQAWVAQAQEVASASSEPVRDTGPHCTTPFECGFRDHCEAGKPKAEFPVTWLPRVQATSLKAHLASPGVLDMRDVPDALLNATQLRVKQQTLAGFPYFDAAATARWLQPHRAPLYFLDFETIQFAVPRWAGTRPYEQIPFQFSLHVITQSGALQREGFLDLSGGDPSASFAEALVRACGSAGAIFVYNSGFETARMKELGARYPHLRQALQQICARVVDLLPVVRSHYYHPMQEGSWSIKKVLPAMVPALRYDQLEGVQDGGAAMEAYLEAIHPDTTPERKTVIEQQLQAYCGLDTYAMVRMWQVLSGHWHLKL
jgi:predicted RecB family nuclease